MLVDARLRAEARRAARNSWRPSRKAFRVREVQLGRGRFKISICVASNSAVPATYEICDGHGFHIEEVSVNRSIAASAASRGDVRLVLISNFMPGSAQTMPGTRHRKFVHGKVRTRGRR